MDDRFSQLIRKIAPLDQIQKPMPNMCGCLLGENLLSTTFMQSIKAFFFSHHIFQMLGLLHVLSNRCGTCMCKAHLRRCNCLIKHLTLHGNNPFLSYMHIDAHVNSILIVLLTETHRRATTGNTKSWEVARALEALLPRRRPAISVTRLEDV